MARRTFQAVCIRPKSFFHFGEKGIGIEEVSPYPHSDTIFSAMCFSHLQLYGQEELEMLLCNFITRNPPFLLSSVFPFYGEDSPKIFLFPKPHIIPMDIDHEGGSWDKLKKASYISKTVFEDCLVNGVESILRGLSDGNLCLKGETILDESEASLLKVEKLYEKRQSPRNTIKRLKPTSTIYYIGATSYTNSGMYLLMNTTEEYIGRIDNVLNLLRDEGIGGERTLGYGRFDFFREKLEMIEADESEAFVTLSLYHPTEDEVKIFAANVRLLRYKLLTRDGFALSPMIKGGKRKRRVRMMLEGSVFPRIEGRSLYGGFPKVLSKDKTGSHAVYRYGYAFPLAIKV